MEERSEFYTKGKRQDGNEPRALPQGQPREDRTMTFRKVVEQHAIESGGRPADDNVIAGDDAQPACKADIQP
ncbi:hypothetical protein LTR70_010758 [Exophiala xenobiotica]|uniref:Uncharacterized protein n=1 Tax=Lithohypha guttulata TaxID=1690604 RepID=A0ABR0JSX8_9EURO|nr:hypothetical protein LTR24_010741 [Lithohypha guttulata]KAK5308885.1 hypothetical protein LTR70_010758 [Exophiala xenobiotica]